MGVLQLLALYGDTYAAIDPLLCMYLHVSPKSLLCVHVSTAWGSSSDLAWLWPARH